MVTPFYDSLVGKLIVHAPDRPQAIDRMVSALAMLRVEGIHTTAPFHQAVLADPEFRAGRIDTHFLERFSFP